MLDTRQERILQAVIREHILTAEPVGSQALLQKYDLGCSAATIRHEMSRLEEAGYLGHPHTSAGRVPLERAYRFYVDQILATKLSPPPEEASIRGQYRHAAIGVDNLMERTSKLLASLTRYTALVLGPRLRRSFLKYLQLVPLNEHSILMVLLANTGQVVNRVVELDGPASSQDLERMTNLLNDRLRGRSLGDISSRLLQDPQRPAPRSSMAAVQRELLAHVGEVMQQAALSHDSRVVCDGAANLCAAPEFRDGEKLRVILEMLEEEKALADVLNQTLAAGAPSIQVTLGREFPFDAIRDCAMVTATYHIGGDPVGSVGILGPTRLPYERVISIVSCVAECFSSQLGSLQGGS